MSYWIKIHKQITECPYWKSEPFSRGQAWIDMLLLANAADGFVRKQGVRVDLQRGDLGWSEVELASRWQWSRGKVRRFLEELEKDGMIARKNASKTDRRKFVITICNYCKYQSGKTGNGTGDGTSDGTGDGQATVQEDRKKERKKDISLPKTNKAIPQSVEEVAAYCTERNNGIDPQYFFDSNTAKGWVVGKNKTPMKDWKAAIRTWEANKMNFQGQQNNQIRCAQCEYKSTPICQKKSDSQRVGCVSFVEKAA